MTHRASAHRWPLLFGAAVVFLAQACQHDPPAATPASEPALAPSASAAVPAASAPLPVAVASASASVVASASAAPPPLPPPDDPKPAEKPTAAKDDDDDEKPVARPAQHTPDPKNKAKPALESKDLTRRARHLFAALKADDPKVGADFFFPRDPFLPLKDIKNPGKYWDQLFKIYANDIHELHRKHAKDWDDATFVSFELGSNPSWVKPGEEANKIGYFRTFNGKLRYKARGKTHTIEVKTIISWDEGWYVTHLLPIKKK